MLPVQNQTKPSGIEGAAVIAQEAPDAPPLVQKAPSRASVASEALNGAQSFLRRRYLHGPEPDPAWTGINPTFRPVQNGF